MGILERVGGIRIQLIADRQRAKLQPAFREHVEPESALYTDGMAGTRDSMGNTDTRSSTMR